MKISVILVIAISLIVSMFVLPNSFAQQRVLQLPSTVEQVSPIQMKRLRQPPKPTQIPSVMKEKPTSVTLPPRIFRIEITPDRYAIMGIPPGFAVFINNVPNCKVVAIVDTQFDGAYDEVRCYQDNYPWGSLSYTDYSGSLGAQSFITAGLSRYTEMRDDIDPALYGNLLHYDTNLRALTTVYDGNNYVIDGEVYEIRIKQTTPTGSTIEYVVRKYTTHFDDIHGDEILRRLGINP